MPNGSVRTFRPRTFRPRTFRPGHFGHGRFGHGKCQRWTFRSKPYIVGWGVCMHKCVIHLLGNNWLNNLIYTIHCISPKFLSVIKLHVSTSRDENRVDPDQVGSWMILICSVLKKKDKTRFSMKVVNIHQLSCTVDSKIHKNYCKHKLWTSSGDGYFIHDISFTAVYYTP